MIAEDHPHELEDEIQRNVVDTRAIFIRVFPVLTTDRETCAKKAWMRDVCQRDVFEVAVIFWGYFFHHPLHRVRRQCVIFVEG